LTLTQLKSGFGSWGQEASQRAKEVLMINYLSPDFTDLPGLRDLLRNYTRSAVTCEHIDVSIITPYYNTEAFFLETVA
jgi:hypothetical protein